MAQKDAKREKRANGEGTWGISDTGKITLKRMVGYLPNGNPKYLTVSGTSKNICKRKMDARVTEYINKSVNSDIVKRMSFLELCERYQEEDKKKKGKLKEGTIKRNGCTIRNQIAGYSIGNIQVHSVKSDDIEEHIRTLIDEDLSVSTVEKTFYIINKTLRWAKNKKYIAENPCEEIKEDIYEWLRRIDEKNKSLGEIEVFSEQEIKDIIGLVKGRKNKPAHKYIFGLSVLLLLYTGMRVGELCALRWKHWSYNSKTLTIALTVGRREKEESDEGTTKIENEIKNCQSRTIILSDKALWVLEELYKVTPYNNENDYISLNSKYKRTCPNDFDSKINRFYRDCGFSKTKSGAHILRRTCATEMYRNGSRVEEIATYLGDAPETIWKHYIKVTEKIISEGEVMNVVAYPRSNPTLLD